MTVDRGEAPQAAAAAATLYREGNYARAAEAYEVAQAAYQEAGALLLAAEMANNRAVALMHLDDYTAALDILQDTPELFEEAGDWQRAGQAHGNLASALEGLGQHAAAEQGYRRALVLFERAGDGDGRSHTAKSLSQLQLKQGHAVEAVATMQGGLEGSARLSLRDRILRWLLRLPSRFLPG